MMTRHDGRESSLHIEQLQLICNAFPALISYVDRNLYYRFCNSAHSEWFELRREEIAGKLVFDVLGEAAAKHVVPYLQLALDGQATDFEAEFAYKHGGTRWVHMMFMPHQSSDGQIIGAFALVIDMSERKRSEERLHDQRRMLETVANHATVALFITDKDRQCTYMNPAAEHLTGFKLEELQRKPLHDMIHHTRLDGSHYFSDECPINRASMQNSREQGLEVFVHKDGHYYDAAFTASPIHDSSGHPIGTVIELRDITAKKKGVQEELRASEARHEQIAKASREADRRKNEYLAKVAHELRNPLAPMLNAAQLIQQLGGSLPKVAQASEIIHRQVLHMARLIDDLLEVVRIAGGKFALRKEPIDICALIRVVAEDHRSLIEAAGLHLQLSLVDEHVLIKGDKTRLVQVTNNLLQNAIKFTPCGGCIHLELVRDHKYAVMRVKDTGIGIPPELLPQIFEPFAQEVLFLNHSTGGLGLGLSVVKGVVQSHGGSVTASSRGRGAGATFEVKLPLFVE